MSAVLNFDASQIAPDTGAQDPVPAGWYNVMIDQTELKPTKDATGNYLEVRHTILDGGQQGKKVYGRLNLRNANPTAQEIGYKQLSAICHSVGVIQVQDSAQLHNIPLKIKVKLRAASGEYEASNEIVAWKNINEQVQMAGAVAAGFPAPATPQGYAPPAFAPAAPVTPPAQQPPQAPAQFAPQQQAPAQPQWQPPAVQQPWQQPAQQAPQMPQQAPQQAPVQPAQQPQWQQPAQQPVQQPAQAPQAAPQQPQQPQQAPAAAPAQQPWNGAQTATPPWMATPPQA